MADIIITQAGLEALVNAQQNGIDALLLSSVQFGTGKYTPTGSETALQSSFKTLTTISGGQAGDNVVHITVSDVSSEAYTVYEVGVFTSTGVLFAVASQSTPIIQKASGSQALLSLDFVVESAGDGDITLGDTNFFNPLATTEMAGVVELATAAEAASGLDSSKAVTPAALAKAGACFDAASIPGVKIANGGIATAQLGDGAVTTIKLASGAVTAAKIEASAVTSEGLAAGSVTTVKLGASCVTDGKIAAGAVSTGNLKDSSVTSSKIANSSVTEGKLASSAVTTEKLADGAVTPEKLAELDINDLPQSWLDALMPAGQYLEMASTQLPARSLLCNGSLVSRTTYSRLFAAIGTRYGAGDGSTTFKLPDTNGRVLQGTTDLEQVGQYLEASLPNITGSLCSYGWTLTDEYNGACYSFAPGSNPVFPNNGPETSYAWFAVDASKSASIYKQGTASVQPQALLAMTCIRY